MNFISSGIGQLKESLFARNVAVVASGTAVAQVIGIASAPVITRLYGPEAFGLQGVFLSVVALLSTIAALGYPIAIVLPRDDGDAIGLVWLSVGIAVLVAVVTTVLLYFFGGALLALLNAESIAGFMYLIPLAMLMTALGVVLGQWLIRKQAFKISSSFVVVNAILVAGAKVVGGFVVPTAGMLISTNVIASLMTTMATYVGWKRFKNNEERVSRPDLSPGKLFALAKRHADFPLLRTPQNLINAISQGLPVLLLASYFGAGAAGQYALAIAVLALPANLIGGSVMSVFYPRVNESILEGEDARKLIIDATKGMAAIGFLPILLICIAGPALFQFVFGQEWGTSGSYAQWLAFWIFLQFVNKPAVAAVAPLRLQHGLLIYELFSTGTKLLALWLGFKLFGSDLVAVALFSLAGIAAYLWLIAWVIKNSGQERVAQLAVT